MQILSSNLVKFTTLKLQPENKQFEERTTKFENNLTVSFNESNSLVIYHGQLVYLKKFKGFYSFKGKLSGFEDSMLLMNKNSELCSECFQLQSILGFLVEESVSPSINYILPLPPLGTLSQLLKFSTSYQNEIPFSFNSSSKITMILDIIEGLVYLHDNNIIHGFLHPTNILIYEHSRIKLSEFGWFHNLEDTIKSEIITNDHIRYSAPELLLHYSDSEIHSNEMLQRSSELLEPNFTNKIDIYSFGCIIYSIVTHKLPYNEIYDNKTLLNTIFNRKNIEISNNYLEIETLKPLEEIIHSCMKYHTENRNDSINIFNLISKIYYKIIINTKLQLKEKRLIKITNILNEIKQYELRIVELEDLILNGKPLIQQKEVSFLIFLKNFIIHFCVYRMNIIIQKI